MPATRSHLTNTAAGMRQRARCSILRVLPDARNAQRFVGSFANKRSTFHRRRTQWSAILRLALAVASVRRNQLDALLHQFGIELVRLVGGILNEVLWSLQYQPLRSGGLDQRDFMRRRAIHVPCHWQAMAVSDSHDPGN